MAGPGNPAWTKGVSGNPGGRPAVVGKVRKWAQAHTVKARKTLLDLMLSGEKEGTRLEAAKTILKLAGVSFASETEDAALNQQPRQWASPEAIRSILESPEKPLN